MNWPLSFAEILCNYTQPDLTAKLDGSNTKANSKNEKTDMLRTKFQEMLKDSMRTKNQAAVGTIRLILAALKDRDIAARGKGLMDGISDDEILAMLQTMVKQRRESIDMYQKGGRQELAAQEQAEIEIIESFLPQQFTADETNEAIESVIIEIAAEGLKDMGRTMAELKKRYAGQMDFGKASNLVKQRLSGQG